MTDKIYDMSRGKNSLAAEMMDIGMQGSLSENELAFYSRRIRANGGVTLDQACGTGRHIFPLLALGLEVHGADISADALSLPNKKPGHRMRTLCSITSEWKTVNFHIGMAQFM